MTDEPKTDEGIPQLPPLPPFAAPGRVAASERAGTDWQFAELVEVRRETARAVTLRLALPGAHPHTAGQHYMLRLTAADGYTAQRHYSVASAPDPGGVVEFTVDRVADGEVSGFLHDVARVGDLLEVRGPLGGFFAWDGSVPALLVGGGSGVVPLMSMLRQRRAGAASAPVHLVACARTPGDLLYRDELAGPDTTVLYSREAPADDLRGPGRLTAADLAPHVVAGREAYVCGPTGFAEHAGRLLAALGVPPRRIRVERFGQAPSGATVGRPSAASDTRANESVSACDPTPRS